MSNKLSRDEDLQNNFEDVVSGIHAKIKDFSVRETKNSGIIELPDKVYVRETVDFAAEQKTLYDRVREELKIEVVKDGELIEDDSSAIVC